MKGLKQVSGRLSVRRKAAGAQKGMRSDW